MTERLLFGGGMKRRAKTAARAVFASKIMETLATRNPEDGVTPFPTPRVRVALMAASTKRRGGVETKQRGAR